MLCSSLFVPKLIKKTNAKCKYTAEHTVMDLYPICFNHYLKTQVQSSSVLIISIISYPSTDQVNKIGYACFLQALWGIRPRQLVWDPLWARADVDDLWSTMLGALHSPFSPSKLELGFPERDAYPKSFLVLQLHDCFQRW